MLKYYLPVDAFYTLGHMVDHIYDTPIESFVVHSPSVEQVEPCCEGSQALFETSSIFREGKIHRMNYNMMKPIVDSIILSYISQYHSHTS